MKSLKVLAFALAATACSLAAAGCGSDTTATTDGAGRRAAEGSDSGGVNGCTPAAAVDDTADKTATVAFGGTLGDAYSPSCLRIKKGSKVTFEGDFTLHPLGGGPAEVPTGGTVDPTSPITVTTTGMSATFTFPDSGTFGFFCENHGAFGMFGAVIVE